LCNGASQVNLSRDILLYPFFTCFINYFLSFIVSKDFPSSALLDYMHHVNNSSFHESHNTQSLTFDDSHLSSWVVRAPALEMCGNYFWHTILSHSHDLFPFSSRSLELLRLQSRSHLFPKSNSHSLPFPFEHEQFQLLKW